MDVNHLLAAARGFPRAAGDPPGEPAGDKRAGVFRAKQMTRSGKLLKNAVANVARGSSAALVALLLPPFLTRAMSVEAYGAWALVLQLSAYIGYLDFGIQTAVGRFVAYTHQKGDTAHRDQIVSTSLVALTAAGLLGLAASVGAAILLPHLFPQIPAALARDARVALMLVASSLAVGLPASVFNGIFIGLQRYEVPAVILAGSKALSAVLLVLIVRHGGDLARMGAAMAAVNLAAYGLQYLLYRKLAPAIRASMRLFSRAAGKELFDYCLSLSVWSFAMLLVTGLDVLLVGYFEFRAVAYYSVAATLVVFLAGLQNAVFGVLIPASAEQSAREAAADLGVSMITATRYGAFLLLLTGLPLVLFARRIVAAWLGPEYALHGTAVMQVLVAANMIRLSAVPYIMMLLGTGQQRLVILTPLLEGFSNLLASLIGGYLFGAMGVAIGTLVGAAVGVGGNIVYNMRRTVRIEFRMSDYLRDGLFRPMVCALPLMLCTIALQKTPDLSPAAEYSCAFAALTLTAILGWRWGLVGAERAKLRSLRLAAQS